jgi:hypothetical protein
MHSSSRFKQIFSYILISLSMQVTANSSKLELQADTMIDELYHSLQNKPKMDMPERITLISARLLGIPYQLGALGEGNEGHYDQAPLYRIDAFDCETYVDTVLALALAGDPKTFRQCIRQIRYRDGHVSFIDRNHFTCLDWNQNNQRQGFIKDITTTFHDQLNQPVAKFAQALINKSAWYQHFTTDHIRLEPPSKVEQMKRLEALKQKASDLPSTASIIPYIPLSTLFNEEGKVNEFLLKQIPHAAIIEIIRPNWDLDKEIGTHLNVSHLGFAIWMNETLYFRETSSTHGRSVDYPLVQYLREAQKSPTIKGINVQIIIPQQPFIENCGRV